MFVSNLHEYPEKSVSDSRLSNTAKRKKEKERAQIAPKFFTYTIAIFT